MKPIVVNYSIAKEIDVERLQEIANGCQSSNHTVRLNLYDFSISKKILSQIESVKAPENVKISAINKDYEELSDYVKIAIQDLIKHMDAQSNCFLNESVVLVPNAVDDIDFNLFNTDENYGFLYFDYEIEGLRCFIKSTGNKGAIPAIFFSTKKTMENISKEDPIKSIFTSTISLHIPKSLCKVYANNEKQ